MFRDELIDRRHVEIRVLSTDAEMSVCDCGSEDTSSIRAFAKDVYVCSECLKDSGLYRLDEVLEHVKRARVALDELYRRDRRLAYVALRAVQLYLEPSTRMMLRDIEAGVL